MAIGFRKQGLVSKTSWLVITAAFLIGVATTISAKLGIYNGSIPMLAILGIFAAGQAWMGMDLATAREKDFVRRRAVYRYPAESSKIL